MGRGNRITVHLGQLKTNVMAIKSVLNDTLLMAVVKANGYGHHAEYVARAALEAGADMLAVARPQEGIALRHSGITAPILVLGATSAKEIESCITHCLMQTVMDIDTVRLIDETAQKIGQKAVVHVKLDTGMNRIGIHTQEEWTAIQSVLAAAEYIRWEGVYTHFADADGETEAFTVRQIQLFDALTRHLPKTILRHAANSAATLRYPKAHFDMVRVGIALYGYPPVNTALPLHPVLEWECEVVYVKTIEKGETVSYGRTFTADRQMQLATLALGYGDGYHRAASNCGKVLINGAYARIVGRICMDQTIVDVTDIPLVCVGAKATLIGKQKDKQITAEDIARACGTISYEVLLAPTDRVQRVYVHD